MQYKKLGRTDLKVSALSLGTVALGINYGITPSDKQDDQSGTPGLPPPSLAEASRLIHKAIDGGINFIDTARAYGMSEDVIGRVLQGRRTSVYLATKVNCLAADGTPLKGQALRNQMRESLTTSLKLLRTGWVDLLMIHSAPVALLQAGEATAILKEFQTEGMARYTGASTYGLESPRFALESGEVDALQVAYNVLDQRMADEIFPLAKKKEVGIVVRSVYLKGALTERAEDLPDRLEPLKQQYRRFRQTVARCTPPLSPVQAALRFVLSRPDVATTLIGVRSEQELATALEAAETGPLSSELIADLRALRWDDPVLLNPGNWGIP